MIFNPDYLVSPGDVLADVLGEQVMTANDLAAKTRLPIETVERILHGLEPVGVALATTLERATGVPTTLWLGLEARYRNPKGHR